MNKLVKGLAMVVAVAAVARFLPDFVRYMKIRAM